jgi:two-component system sensor histidine kinase BarA
MSSGTGGLERRCCFVFGTGIVLVVAGSFYWYGNQSEKMVLDQNKVTCRTLVNPIVMQHHWLKLDQDYEFRKVIRSMFGDLAPDELRFANWKFIKPLNLEDPAHRPESDFEYAAMEAFQKREGGDERTRGVAGESAYQYVSAMRLSNTCVACHGTRETADGPVTVPAQDVVAAISITVPLDRTNKAIQANRMRLITMATVTAVFGMALSYVSVHYLVVRPMKP